jgi:tetratricopeptide (TPR) repeat protein
MKGKQKKKRPNEPAVVEVPPVPVGSDAPAVLPLLVAVLLVAILGATAFVRNAAYKSPVTLWADASSKSVNKRRTHENYGQALSTAGKLTEALNQFQTVLSLPNDGSVPPRDVYRELGVVYFRMGRIEDSITAWQTGLQYAPGDPSLLNNLSVAYINRRRYDDAERTIKMALAADPTMPYALNSLGEILMMKGSYQEALEKFAQAIEVSPDTPSRYWNAALAAEKAGKPDLAFQYANQYVAIEPNPAQRQRGVMFLENLKARYPAARK